MAGGPLVSQEAQLQIVDAYRGGEYGASIAKRHGCCYATVMRILKKHGVTPTYGKRVELVRPELLAEVVALTKQGVSRMELSKRFHVRHETIVNWLRAAGIHVGLRPGRKNYSGRWKLPTGYINILVRPDDPLWPMRTAQGYIPEHRLVMAQHLKRLLLPSETVHHINGKRDDNRLENLELRQGKHGKGMAFICADCGSRNIRAETLA